MHTPTNRSLCLALAVLVLLSANGAPAAALETPLRSTPDFGGNLTVFRDAEGVGATPEQAVLAALQSAVTQVNGAHVASQLRDLGDFATAVEYDTPGGKISVRSKFFRKDKNVSAVSSGTVLGYEILSQEEVDKTDTETVEGIRTGSGKYHYSSSDAIVPDDDAGMRDAVKPTGIQNEGRKHANAPISHESQLSFTEAGRVYKTMHSVWKVRIRAEIAQYRAPDEQGRPKIVVALPRAQARRYPVGEDSVAADTVARAIRERLSGLLSQTGRFIVLDRESDAELEAETGRIESGKIRSQDRARLGQQWAADLILISELERFEYRKRVRPLRLSNRQLASWSGGGRIALRLVHAATGEVALSERFEYRLPATGPSTLPRAIDSQGMADTMMDALAGQIGQAIVTRLFPENRRTEDNWQPSASRPRINSLPSSSSAL